MDEWRLAELTSSTELRSVLFFKVGESSDVVGVFIEELLLVGFNALGDTQGGCVI